MSSPSTKSLLAFDHIGTPFFTDHNPGVLIGIANPILRDRLADQLENGGFQVWTTGAASQAIDLVFRLNDEIDVIVIDYAIAMQPRTMDQFKSKSPSASIVVIAAGIEANEIKEMFEDVTCISPSSPRAEVLSRFWDVIAFGIGNGSDSTH